MTQDNTDTQVQEMHRLLRLTDVVCVPLPPMWAPQGGYMPNGQVVPAPGPNMPTPTPNMPMPDPSMQMPNPNMPAPGPVIPEAEQPTGGLIVSTTTLRKLYPVPKARVTVFTGPYENMEVVDKAVTDDSGRTKEFRLETPARSLSESFGSVQKPYALYNVMVQADGFVDTVNSNIPIFAGVTSLQNIDMVLRSAAGGQQGPRFINEPDSYQL